jgi:hypothetical protein
MATVLRVLLWTVVLIAPGGFLLVPVLAATSLGSRSGSSHDPRQRFSTLLADARQALAALQRRWLKH